MKTVGQTWFNHVTLTCRLWSQGQHDLFHGPVTLPYTVKTIWYMNIIDGIMIQYDQMFDLKTKVGHCDLYFMVHWFCLISRRLFDVWTSFFGIMSRYDWTFDPKITVGHCDLYFMVHSFCLISWLFDIWTSLFGIMSQYDPTFDLKINVDHCDLYFMVQWFCFIFPRLFDGWANETVWPKLWPQSKYRSIWPIFHGLVILLNIFEIIWWMTIIDGIMDQCDTEIDLIKYMCISNQYFMVQ